MRFLSPLLVGVSFFLSSSSMAVPSPPSTAGSQASAYSYRLTILAPQGSGQSIALAINNANQVVGAADFPSGTAYHATVWNGTTATDLNPAGSTQSVAFDINDRGQVVGSSNTPNTSGATLWNGTSATYLSTPGYTGGMATGINNAGDVVGYASSNWEGIGSAMLWNGTTSTELSPLGTRRYSYASAINNAGQVAGNSVTASAQHATIWNGTTITDLGTLPGWNNSMAYGINDKGEVVGYSEDTVNDIYHATLWNGTTVTDLGTLGGSRSNAADINNAGQIVGYSYAAGETYNRATLWSGTTITDLNSFLDADSLSAGWFLSTAQGINDSGSIVGQAINIKTGAFNAFLLSVDAPDAAVPEPGSATILLTGLGLLALLVQLRSKTP